MSLMSGKAARAAPPRGGCRTPVLTSRPPCRPLTVTPCGWVSPMSKKQQTFRAGHRHLALSCCCPEQTLGSPQVAVEICLGTPGPDRFVATKGNKKVWFSYYLQRKKKRKIWIRATGLVEMLKTSCPNSTWSTSKWPGWMGTIRNNKCRKSLVLALPHTFDHCREGAEIVVLHK